MIKILKIAASVILCALLMSNSFYVAHPVVLYPARAGQAVLYQKCEKIYAQSPEVLCRTILDRLFELQNRGAPYLPDNMSVSVRGTCATVNLVRPTHTKISERDELMLVYSIVNSLTSDGSIITVEFTVNGKKQKNYAGFLDMRETFIPDYDICS